MLILSRRPGESLTVGEDIVITVCRLQYGSVKLGITAPREMPVVRKELLAAAGRGAPPAPQTPPGAAVTESGDER